MPELAMPTPLPVGAPLWQRVRAARESTIGLWNREAFDAEIIRLRFGKRRLFVANAPDLVAHVLLENPDNYVKSPIARQLLEPSLGRGLLTAEGESWRRQRRVMAPAFTARKVADFAPAMVKHAERLLEDWDRLPLATTIDIAAEMSRLTLAIISEAMFSVADDPEVATIGGAVAAYQAAVRPSFADLLGLPAWVPRPERWRARRIFAKADQVIRRLIDERRRQGGPDDLLSAMLAAEEDGTAATAQEVRDQVATIFTAGHETTANALAWTWYLLSLHPDVEAKLHRELIAVLGDRLPTVDDMPNLVYTRMVVEESMRLYPPAHTMPRMALNDDRLRDTHVPAGSIVMVVPWLLHRHRRLWERPDEFDPERFSPEASAGRPRFAYVPFGAGPRICIGAAFAMTEAILLTATIASRYRLRLADSARIEPVGLITLRARNGMPMTVESRKL
ncbi:MAG TPA: cytochrome P450 [Alphaproteobacteria bacterium]|nr:cytochrome P450 [Alphaproteobacteria bacterium]